jgi:hypothetical protein
MASSSRQTQLLSDSESYTGQLSRWVDQLSSTEVPAHIKTQVKYLILDALACGFVGAQLPWSKIAAKGIFDIETSGSCSVFRWSKVSPLHFILEAPKILMNLTTRHIESDTLDCCIIE